MGSDDLHQGRRRSSRKIVLSSDIQTSTTNNLCPTPCDVNDNYQLLSFLNSSNLETPVADLTLNSVQQQIMQYQLNAIMEWKKNFEQWQNKYANSMKKKEKRRARSAKSCVTGDTHQSITSIINIGDDSPVIVDKSIRIAQRRPPYFLKRGCCITCDYYTNYYSIKPLFKEEKRVFHLEALSFNDSHPLLDDFKGSLGRNTTVGKVVNFVIKCIQSHSSFRLNSLNSVLWYYACTLVKNSGVPDMSEVAQYFLCDSSLTALLARWNTDFNDMKTSLPQKGNYEEGNNYIFEALEYFISVRSWGAAFSLCGGDSTLRAHVQKRYIREIGKLNPLSTCFSFLNKEPIAFLETCTEEFTLNYTNHLLVILVFSHLNTHLARLITYKFAERLISVNIRNFAHLCYLISNCYPSYNFNDDKYQLIGYYDELPDDLLDKDHFLESIILNEVIEYGLKQNDQIWRNSMKFKLYIIRYLIEAKDYTIAFIVAGEFAHLILQEPEQFSKFLAFQLYSLAETLFLCLNCYENPLLAQPKWLAFLKDVYKGNRIKFPCTSTPETSLVKDIILEDSTIKPRNMAHGAKRSPRNNKQSGKSSVKKPKISVIGQTADNVSKTTDSHTKSPKKLQPKLDIDDGIIYDNVDSLGSVNEICVSPADIAGETSTQAEDGITKNNVQFLTVDPAKNVKQQNMIGGETSFAKPPFVELYTASQRKDSQQTKCDTDSIQTWSTNRVIGIVGNFLPGYNNSAKSRDNLSKNDCDEQDNIGSNENCKAQGPTKGTFDQNSKRQGLSSMLSSKEKYIVNNNC